MILLYDNDEKSSLNPPGAVPESSLARNAVDTHTQDQMGQPEQEMSPEEIYAPSEPYPDYPPPSYEEHHAPTIAAPTPEVSVAGPSAAHATNATQTRESHDEGSSSQAKQATSRDAPPARAYPLFAPIVLSGDKALERGFPLQPPQSSQKPHPFSTHDVPKAAWERFLQELNEEAKVEVAQKPDAITLPRIGLTMLGLITMFAGMATAPKDKENVEGCRRVVDRWNTKFFEPRGMQVLLTKDGGRVLNAREASSTGVGLRRTHSTSSSSSSGSSTSSISLDLSSAGHGHHHGHHGRGHHGRPFGRGGRGSGHHGHLHGRGGHGVGREGHRVGHSGRETGPHYRGPWHIARDHILLQQVFAEGARRAGIDERFERKMSKVADKLERKLNKVERRLARKARRRERKLRRKEGRRMRREEAGKWREMRDAWCLLVVPT
ncbi:hypothetical protein PLICRDRAFT_696382 [Plicaturopsis crispa FD-325 SS-3]|nr:hypothetical protein PLICRDRAFT_696382 [Plicaturopsis crispa FD-325 SS-3]